MSAQRKHQNIWGYPLKLLYYATFLDELGITHYFWCYCNLSWVSAAAFGSITYFIWVQPQLIGNFYII